MLVCTADCITNRVVHFEHPDWPLGFDLDRDQGVKTRRAMLDRCAAEKTLVSSYHLPFPGIGHIVRTTSSYKWLPTDFNWQIAP
jgi:hypothetical protein